MPKSSSQRRREKQQAAAEEVATLREQVATLEQQARARKPLRHGTPAARTPASRPSASRAEPLPQEPSLKEDGKEPEEEEQQQQSEHDDDSDQNDSESGDDGGARTPSHSSDGGEYDPDGAIQSGLAGDVLAGVQEQHKSGSADKSRSIPPDVASTLAGILQKHSDEDTVPPAWALNMLLPAPTSQLCSAVASNSADIQDLAAEVKRLRTARNPKATSQTPSGGRKASTKRGHPHSSTGSDGQRKSSKTTEQRHCDYPKCNNRSSHDTDHCNLKKRVEKDGFERIRK